MEYLPDGTLVQIRTVDEDGLWGRDEHPDATDRGKLGVVISNYVEFYADGGYRGMQADVTAAQWPELARRYPQTDDGGGLLAMYRVQLIGESRKVQMAYYELEAVPEASPAG